MTEKTAKRLLRLLDAEHAAITAGKFEILPDLGVEKEELFAALSKAPPSRDTVGLIDAATTRNQRVLEAAMQGVQAAVQTLNALDQVQKGSVVYGSDGKVSRMSKGDLRMSQRL